MPIANQELIKVFLDANVNINLIETIELIHPSFSQTWYLCKNTENFDGKLENDSIVTYLPHGFSYILPTTSTKGQNNARFVIDATTTEAMEDIWAYKQDPTTPIILNWRQYFSTSNEIQTSSLSNKLMNVELNYNQISGSGSRPDIVNRPFPYERYDATKFKGLKYV